MTTPLQRLLRAQTGAWSTARFQQLVDDLADINPDQAISLVMSDDRSATTRAISPLKESTRKRSAAETEEQGKAVEVSQAKKKGKVGSGNITNGEWT